MTPMEGMKPGHAHGKRHLIHATRRPELPPQRFEAAKVCMCACPLPRRKEGPLTICGMCSRAIHKGDRP